MRAWIRKLWPVFKWLLTVAILFAIGRVFYRLGSNPDLLMQPVHLGWSTLAGVLYILALGCYTFYWVRLLRRLGQRPTLAVALRAYFLGLMGKYLPGKAWALVMRAGLSGGKDIRLGVAAMTSFYEVLTTMSAGVLLAAVLFAILGPDPSEPFSWQVLGEIVRLERPESVVLGRWALALLSLGLLVAIGTLIVPPVFNRLVHRLSLPFRDADAEPWPKVTWSALLEGLGLGACGWMLMGLSLGAALQAVVNQAVPWDVPFMGRMAACMGLGYVAGFVIIVVPSALGVREFFLTLLLVPELRSHFGMNDADAVFQAVRAVVLLRLSWTVAEAAAAAAVYWMPGAKPVQHV